jgi:hypothetical protein
MQSDPPQGDPRLQRINPEPTVATGYVDPCIVYLETTAPGEVPLLGIGWASSSQVIRKSDGRSHLELRDVRMVKGLYEKPLSLRNAKWSFSTRDADHLILNHEKNDALSIEHSFFTCRFKGSSVLIPQWKIRYLTPEFAASLRRILLTEGSSHPNWVAQVLLEQAKLDWPSIAEALASLKPKVPTRRRRSLVRRLFSSIFKKKPQPVHA